MSGKNNGRTLGAAIAVAIAAMLTISSCAARPPRTAAEQSANDHLAAAVMAAMLADPDLYAQHIYVDADGGVVHLSGYIWSVDELYEARRVAATVPGVTRVDAQLEISVGGRAGSR